MQAAPAREDVISVATPGDGHVGVALSVLAGKMSEIEEIRIGEGTGDRFAG